MNMLLNPTTRPHLASATQALVALNHVVDRLHAAGDARAAFPDVYAIITRRVREEITRPDCAFLEPEWISRLAGRFCDRYLDTLRWSLTGCDQDSGAWAVAYACAADTRATPLHNTVLGLSAHINRDLVKEIRATIVAFGHYNDPVMLARYKHDHDYVNTILDASIPETFDLLATKYGCRPSALIAKYAYRPARWVTMALLRYWREQVWSEVVALLDAADSKETASVHQRVDARSALIGEVLSLGLGRRAVRWVAVPMAAEE